MEKRKYRLISVDETTYLRLKARKKPKQSFADVINELLDFEEFYKKEIAPANLRGMFSEILIEINDIRNLLLRPELRAEMRQKILDFETHLAYIMRKLNQLDNSVCKHCKSPTIKVEKVLVRNKMLYGVYVKCRNCLDEDLLVFSTQIKMTEAVRYELETKKYIIEDYDRFKEGFAKRGIKPVFTYRRI